MKVSTNEEMDSPRDGSSRPDVTAPQPLLGQRLRALRVSRQFSLAEVATATGISTSFLSLVENGGSDITIGRLVRLVDFYGTSIADLLIEDPFDSMVVRADRRRILSSGNEGITVQLLSPDSNRQMSPFTVRLAPGGKSEEHLSHSGEEWTFVISGRIELDLTGVGTIVLDQGDSIYFDAKLGHSYRNLSTADSTFLSVVTPPSM
jgi:transcriptional regulator with XRE-family HTH domain